MYQQHLQNEKSTSATDLLLVALFLLIAVFMRQIVDFCMSLPAPWRSISQLMLFCVFVGICLFVYKRRICSYRYTVIFEPAPEGELDAYGNPLVWPWPIGTILFERMVSDKGKVAEEVAPAELLALLKPGEAPDAAALSADGKKPGYFNTARMTRLSQKTAHTLVFRRDGRLGYVSFHPDDTLRAHIEALLSTKREAAEGQADG